MGRQSKHFLTGKRELLAFLVILLVPVNVIAVQTMDDVVRKDDAIEVTVVVDNRPFRPGLQTSWGFACVVRGFEKTILFDTGGDGAILMSNLKHLNIDPNEIGAVVLSHVHRDHTGGLSAFLAANAQVSVYALSSFPKRMLNAIRASGANLVEVGRVTEICRDVYTTGALGNHPSEQSLVLRTKHGLVVITGCAHPGIVRILKQAKKMFPLSDLLLVMGGFHLMNSTRPDRIASRVQKSKVRYVGPGHCTGKRAQSVFRQMYKDHFISIGAGTRVTISRTRDKLYGRVVCVDDR